MTLHEHDHESRCPYCGKFNQAASGEGRRPAGDGDISLCIECGHFGIFASTAPGGMRKTTAKEAAELATDERCMRFLQAWRTARQVYPRRKQSGNKR